MATTSVLSHTKIKNIFLVKGTLMFGCYFYNYSSASFHTDYTFQLIYTKIVSRQVLIKAIFMDK